MEKYTAAQVGPSAGAGRPSCVATNPRNVPASATRRARLLGGFDRLEPAARATLLELCETISRNAGEARAERADLRAIISRIYTAAGLA